MGTTKTAIQDGSNPQLAFTLTIEGFYNPITDFRENLSAMSTAYAGQFFGPAISGLHRPGIIEQSLEPLRPRIEATSATFVVSPDEDDTLAKLLFASDATSGVHSHLNASQDPGDTTITATASTAAWPTAPSVGYIGVERFEYGGKSGSTLTSVSRGLPSPFAKSGGSTFGRAHRIGTAEGAVISRPTISSYPKRWVGKWVACRAHRVVDGVPDVVAQAQLIFSGRISDITENERGEIVLTCLDARDAVESAVLLSDQYTAKPTEGVYLTTGATFELRRKWETGSFDLGDSFTYTVDGTYLSQGWHTADEIVDSLNEWLAANNYAAVGSSTDWASIVQSSDAKVTVRVKMAGASITRGFFSVKMTQEFAVALGYDLQNPDGRDTSPHRMVYEAPEEVAVSSAVITEVTATFATAYSYRYASPNTTWTVEQEYGSFIDQGDWVPAPWKNVYATTVGVWGFIRMDDFIFLAEYDSGNKTLTLQWDSQLIKAFLAPNPFENISPMDEYAGAFGSNTSVFRNDEEIPRLKQVILMEEPDMEDWIIKTFASTGEDGYNHAQYDKYPAQLSLSIPWDLLDGNFVESATSLANDADFRVLIEKPTKFTEIFLPELALRNAHLCFRDGLLTFSRPAVVDSTSATHTITTSHRAAKPGDEGSDFPRYTRSRSSVVNVAKVEYDRDMKGDYHRVVEISNEQSRSDFGQSQPVTIKARNSMQLRGGVSDASMRDLIADLAGDMLSFHSKPLVIVARSLAATKWFVTPGDTVSLTDDWVRSTTDGTRGVTNEPGWIVRIVQDWSTMIGEVEIALHGEDQSRRATYAPAAKLDIDAAGTTDGYDAAGPYIWVESNEFSLSSEADDVTHFDVDDVITIITRSPSTPASPVKWVRTISAIGSGATANRITLSSPLSSPAFPGTGEEYYIFSDDYAAATSTQQIHAYQGDDADGNIVDTARNRLYIQQPLELGDPIEANTTDRVEWTPTDGSWGADGEPVSPPMHRAMVVYANNLINRRTAPQSPFYFYTNASTTSTSYVLATYPVKYYLGRGIPISLRRRIAVGPAMEQDGGGTGTVRITCSSHKPLGSSAIGAAMTVTFVGSYSQVEITNTSTDWANVAAKTVEVWNAPSKDYTWVTVEIKTSANTCWLHGFHQWYLGPQAP